MTPNEVLLTVYSYLCAGWCQRHTAMNDKGQPCHVYDAEAACWCPYGALGAVRLSDPTTAHEAICREAYYKLRDAFSDLTSGYCSIAAWNDTPGRVQSDVLLLLERAMR